METPALTHSCWSDCVQASLLNRCRLFQPSQLLVCSSIFHHNVGGQLCSLHRTIISVLYTASTYAQKLPLSLSVFVLSPCFCPASGNMNTMSVMFPVSDDVLDTWSTNSIRKENRNLPPKNKNLSSFVYQQLMLYFNMLCLPCTSVCYTSEVSQLASVHEHFPAPHIWQTQSDHTDCS